MFRQCCLGLGANLGNPVRQIEDAVRELFSLPGVTDGLCSSLYISNAMTKENECQADYVNAVVNVKLRTDMRPYELLKQTQRIETKIGRSKKNGENKVWQPRVIDIDILLMGDLEVSDSKLTLPHPGLFVRPFVLYPLNEILPNLPLGNGSTVSSYAAAVKDLWNTRRLEDTRQNNVKERKQQAATGALGDRGEVARPKILQ